MFPKMAENNNHTNSACVGKIILIFFINLKQKESIF